MKSGIVTPSNRLHTGVIAWRRWVSLCVVFCVLLILYTVDQRLKRSDYNGYVLRGSAWSVSVNDVSGAWDAMTGTSTWRGLPESNKRFIRDTEVAFRKSIGVRASPKRWSVWFGKGAVFSGINDDVGVSFRPGLLFRAAHLVLGNSLGNGLSSYGGYFYAWRDGFVLLSSERSFVEYMLEGEVESMVAGNELVGVVVASKNPAPFQCTVLIENGFPVHGIVEYAVGASSSLEGVQSNSANEDPLTIVGAKPHDWFPLLEELMPEWPNLDLVRNMLSGAEEKMGDGDNLATWVLDDMVSEYFLAAPIFSLARMSGSTGLGEYRWGKLQGRKEPWFGRRYEWCEATTGDFQIMANKSENMFENQERWEIVEMGDIDVKITVNYAELSKLIKPVAARAASEGYSEGMNRVEEQVNWARRWEFVENLNYLQLEGEVVSGGIKFSGHLDVPSHE